MLQRRKRGGFPRDEINRRSDELVEELPVGACVGDRVLKGRADGRALDHDRAAETGRLQLGEYSSKIHLAGPELDHDLVAAGIRVRGAERRRAHFTFEKVRTGAILGDHARHVGADDFERGDRILPCVIDHVSRIEEDAEVGMIDLPHPPDQLTGRVVEPVMMLDRNLHAALLADGRRVGQHLGDVEILIFATHPEIERKLLPEGVRIGDLLPHGADGLGERHGCGDGQVGDRRGQPAHGELLLQGGDRLWRDRGHRAASALSGRGGSGARRRGGDRHGCADHVSGLIAGSLDRVEQCVVAQPEGRERAAVAPDDPTRPARGLTFLGRHRHNRRRGDGRRRTDEFTSRRHRLTSYFNSFR